MPEPDFSPENEQQYEELVVSIEASEGIFSLLIAACDDQGLRERIIQRYERELFPEVRGYRLRLNRGEPSLRRAIADWAEQQKGQRRVVLSVTGAEELLWMNLRSEDSGKPELDKFFGYLQWTREGVGQYPYPIVLWVTHRVLQNLSRKAPDFWSWRKGVFRFVSPLVAVPDRPERFVASRAPDEADDEFPLSVEELQELIATTEQQQGSEAPALATLYDRLAQAYRGRIYRGESTNLAKDQRRAIQYFNQAIALQTKLGLDAERLATLTRLGNFYESQSQFQQALDFHQQALELARKLGNSFSEALSLNGLGNTYFFLDQRPQAVDLYQQSLEVSRKLGFRTIEAASLNNLGRSYYSSNQYTRSIDFYRQSLEIIRGIGDRRAEAESLFSLGNAHCSSGQYTLAIDLHQQSLKIRREISDRRAEAESLNNLGITYSSLGQYTLALDLYQQSLEIRREIDDKSGEGGSLCNLGVAYNALGQYQQALELFQQAIRVLQSTGDQHFEANSWMGLGIVLAKLDQKFEAKSAYETARKMYEEMGLEQDAKKCSDAIYGLEQVVPVESFSTPRFERYQPKPPRWRRKLRAFSQRLWQHFQRVWRWLTRQQRG